MLVGMAAARIVAVALAFISVALAAQSPSGIALKVGVKDPTGAAVPGAEVQARASESRITSQTRTDANGEAVLCLEPDTSIVSVRAPGFSVWRYKIEGGRDVDKPLIAVLRISSYHGPTLVNADPGLQTEPQPPIAALIPLESLESLIVLPRRNLRHPGSAHR